MTDRATAKDYLQEVGSRPDAEIDLFESALALAALDRPRTDLGPYREHAADLARDLGNAIARTVPVSEALADVLSAGHGYVGDTLTYDDSQNANLIRVIDRRKGLPVALGILYIHAARRHGIEAEGLNFPGHFLIRIGTGAKRVILDPFNGGLERNAADLRDLLKATAGLAAELEPAHYEPVGNRDILIRLQNNIKARHQRAGNIEEALRTVEGMLLFAPDAMALWREAGVLNARLGKIAAAVRAFEIIAERADSAAARTDAAAIVARLRTRLN